MFFKRDSVKNALEKMSRKVRISKKDFVIKSYVKQKL